MRYGVRPTGLDLANREEQARRHQVAVLCRLNRAAAEASLGLRRRRTRGDAGDRAHGYDQKQGNPQRPHDTACTTSPSLRADATQLRAPARCNPRARKSLASPGSSSNRSSAKLIEFGPSVSK
jgi:hypothetical protein